MPTWFLETGLYLLGVAVVPLVGLLLVCWGLWGDRSKGRPRCPKCWYDMRGTIPRLECPECGYDAGQEPRLHKNRRRWRRVVVGILLIVLFSYPLTIVSGWHREQAVIRMLTATPRPRSARVETSPIGPAWLVSRLPDGLARFFDRGIFASVTSDKELSSCRKLRHLESVEVRGGVTDAGLVHLKGLTRPHTLLLRGSQVTDVGLVHLKGLTQLRELDLFGTQVTDAGLVHLKELTQLQQLAMTGPGVTDAGLVHLKGLSQLQGLGLHNTQVTDAGLVHLKSLTQLQLLFLGKTRVTDTGVAELKTALPNVEVVR